MDFFAELDFSNLEIPHWLCDAQQTDTQHKIMDISPLEGFFNELTDLENFTFNFDSNPPPLYEDFENDQKPLNLNQNQITLNRAHYNGESGFGQAIGSGFVKKEEVSLPLQVSSSSRKKRSDALEFDEIKMHFGVPITKAAKEMNVGLTLLKRRCRELNIRRWPHRKLKSLKLLIDNVKELGLANEVTMLEKHRMMLEKLPGMELNEETKKLRQACFKANYKRRRYMALQA